MLQEQIEKKTKEWIGSAFSLYLPGIDDEGDDVGYSWSQTLLSVRGEDKESRASLALISCGVEAARRLRDGFEKMDVHDKHLFSTVKEVAKGLSAKLKEYNAPDEKVTPLANAYWLDAKKGLSVLVVVLPSTPEMLAKMESAHQAVVEDLAVLQIRKAFASAKLMTKEIGPNREAALKTIRKRCHDFMAQDLTLTQEKG